MTAIEVRLEELGLALPSPAAPVAAYVPAVEAGGLLMVSGQLPFRDGAVMTGHLGERVSVSEGAEAAKACALMILAQAKAAVGFERIARCVRLEGFVACTPDFTDHPKVINGASELMQDVLGEAGRHARFAVGAPSLPLGACVEIGAVFALK
ncbi:RidA family protein [Parvularcula dongshanensis]|uniref:Enamine deaminase RidA (YjgF/YER057c/UK114 family) n=1 Tax=Parvularcula dongshanensis TaxID=1173995 RepID=A0A840I5U8_9PROT|nr:RidA family protein [Parvularcula dongshanensis]MBB4659390.1 enamine deaminase RidA (YjgF/YER057c/UK114 family) [Parvularcula dongshanensis]